MSYSTRDDEEPRVIRWAEMTWTDYVRIGAGLLFFLLGVAGLVLPILQGVLFLIVSAILLAPYSRWVQKQLARLEKRFPSIFQRARGIAKRWRGKRSADE
ncbi:hypothetical protein [Salinisphaera hydrothermalis]|uniref:Transmembrane protein (PGPGW) n=1 Tax=Salinisphaera hydrothermalis (strain C41B8) TaxID=1304275 RepID=A0A084ILC6_SALHC|nr:hypothetical protein [Salinisphaera hydrothermalis]KEZ77510.1 hypothetical protein C41B8_09926 [Salinisphaera hydrothermalis C41B8]